PELRRHEVWARLLRPTAMETPRWDPAAARPWRAYCDSSLTITRVQSATQPPPSGTSRERPRWKSPLPVAGNRHDARPGPEGPGTHSGELLQGAHRDGDKAS